MTLPSLKNTTLKKPPHFGVSGSVKNQLLVLSKSCVPMINLNSKGTYRGKWAPLNLRRSTEPWTDTLPKSYVILHAFELSSDILSDKLQSTTRRHLKDKYTLLKSNAGIIDLRGSIRRPV